MSLLRWIGLFGGGVTMFLAGAIGVMITMAPQYADEWSVTYATTNGLRSSWRMHLLDVSRNVTFTLVEAEMSAPTRPALSPNQRYVVLEGQPMKMLDLWENKSYVLKHGGGNVIWTQDNSRFAYLDEGQTYVTVVNEMGPSEVLMPVGIYLPDYLAGWSPDGTRIAYVWRDMLRILDLNSNETHTLINDDDINFRFVDWSPTSNYLLVTMNYERNLSHHTLTLVPADGGDLVTLIDPLDRVMGMKWAPDGQRALVLEMSGNDRRMHIIALLAEPGKVTHQLTLPLQASHAQWSADSRQILFHNARDHDLYIVDAVGSNLRRLTDNNWRNVLLH